MKISYQIAVLIIVSLMTSACQKVVDLKLNNTESQLVIEGSMTDLPQSQTVTISRSVSFGDPNNFPKVGGATVKITSSTGNIYRCTETSPGTYSTIPVIGRSGNKYTLQVQLDGQTYTAASVMPEKILIDSVMIDEQTFGNSTTKTVAVFYDDPPNMKNQYRFIMYVNDVQVKSVFVRNDQYSDNRKVRVLLYQDDIEIKSGDKITIDVQCIDEAMYTYWYTFSQQQRNLGGGSSAPSNPPNNFDKNVLGYFSANTQQRRTFTVR